MKWALIANAASFKRNPLDWVLTCISHVQHVEHVTVSCANTCGWY